MTVRSWPRLVPALLVAALLFLAAIAPSKPPATPMMPAPPPPMGSVCEGFQFTSGGDSTALFSGGDGFLQPLPANLTVFACSLRVKGTGYCGGTAKAFEWDPVALAPTAGSVRLRYSGFDPSTMGFQGGPNTMPTLSFNPPIVTVSVPGVADPPPTTVAMQVQAASYGDPLRAYYAPEGQPTSPAAREVDGGGTHDLLLGSHPVLASAVCSGDADLQSLRVVQAVHRTDLALAMRPAELVQPFRVNVITDVRWIEFAANGARFDLPITDATNMPAPPPCLISIVDSNDLPGPPDVMPPSLMTAMISGIYNAASGIGPVWATHGAFDRTLSLVPGHLYWIYIKNAAPFEFFTRTINGTESPDFQSMIGLLRTRQLGTDPWSNSGPRALSFKLIGKPAVTLSGPRPGSTTAQFRLAVAPNPARGPVSVDWSGAVGPVQFEVLDARGSRVAKGEGGAAGTWRWDALGSSGRPLPAGVYFVHARDSAGRRSVEHVVVMR